MKIVPALLAETFEGFLRKLRQAESFAEYVQIDLMDGLFVPTKSFPPERVNTLDTLLSFEVHLMVQDPLPLITGLSHPRLKTVVFHLESEGNAHDLISAIRKRGVSAGMAVKPETGLEEFRDIADEVDALMFLTVDPCCYGNPFRPEVLEKIAVARRAFPSKHISVDGGVSLENLKDLFDTGVDSVCVGSRIFLDDDPAGNYRLFLKRVGELENQRAGSRR